MKQVQLRNIKADDLDYNMILYKGLLDENTGYLYFLNEIEQKLFTIHKSSVNYIFMEIQDNNDLTEIELEFLGEFTNILSTLKYYNRKKDYFEAEGKRLASNEDNLALLDLLECYKELDACKEDYIQGLTRIDELNKQLEELQESFSNYLSNTKEDSDIDLLELILTNTPTYLDHGQVKLSLSGKAPIDYLSKLIGFNGELINKEKLFGLFIDIKGDTPDVDFTLIFTYKIEDSLTYSVATKVIKEFKDTSEFLIALNNDNRGQAESAGVTE